MPSPKYEQLRKDGVPDLHNNELLKACREDSELLAELLQENKDFIFSIITYYKGNIETIKDKFNVTEEELLQHAYIGVITALKEFDFDRGVRFTTYMYRPILWEINQLLYSDSKLVRLSRSAIDLIKRMEKIENKLGYFPRPEELAEMLDVPVERIEEVLRFATDLTYIDSLENFEPEDFSVNYEKNITDKVYVENLLKESGLDEFELKVADLIMEGDNNSQIAEKLGVYPMTVNRAIERIRSKVENDFDDKRVSKYEEEIKLITEEMEELGCIMSIEDIKDLLDVCGFDISVYTPRILYYIRQKALKRVDIDDLVECN
jgi:RNA polymerase sigma factor (sigma-70 family)